MPSSKITLQNRITSLMVTSSALFIAVFTFIQINNQITNINRYNTYQANLSSNILKNNIEAVTRQAAESQAKEYIQSSLLELKDSKLVKEALIFNQEGNIIASTKDELVGKTIPYHELGQWELLKDLSESNKWLNAEIDRARKSLNIYIAIKIDPHGPINYVAKLTLPFAGAQEALAAVYKPVMLSIIIIILANIILGYLLSQSVLGPIKVLNNVTKIIAAGDLSVRTSIKTGDELQELGETFNSMTEELIKMKERAENANPLTKLPGNIVIHEEIYNRIQKNNKFTVIYCDLDNFKAFNDKYGIAKGDEAIKLTADVFKNALKLKGGPNDFLGHEGGDDFILITTPERAQNIADSIIKEFDKNVRELYSDEDRTQGYIIAHGRDDIVRKFPIMTISLAGISNANRTISSYGEVTNIAAEIKKKAKAIEGSVFVVDQRK
jgi:diguanylate cyclase (GGDEF)-like protein